MSNFEYQLTRVVVGLLLITLVCIAMAGCATDAERLEWALDREIADIAWAEYQADCQYAGRVVWREKVSRWNTPPLKHEVFACITHFELDRLRNQRY